MPTKTQTRSRSRAAEREKAGLTVITVEIPLALDYLIGDVMAHKKSEQATCSRAQAVCAMLLTGGKKILAKSAKQS